MTPLSPPWQDLAGAGIRVIVRGDEGRIRFPADRFLLTAYWVLAAILSAVLVAIAWLVFHAAFGQVIALVVGVLALVTILAWLTHSARSPFVVVLNLHTGEMTVPTHGWLLVCGGQLNVHEVFQASVDWERAHGQRANANSPITYLSVYAQSAAGEAPVSEVTLDMSRFDGRRARAFVAWLYDNAFPPDATLFPIDAEPVPGAG